MKVWFITGTSRGFGREWTIAALERGDKVAAAARNTTSLKELVDQFGDNILPVQLDVTDRSAAFAAVAEAHAHFGGLDVVVNNAGYTQMGMVEELTELDVRDQLETNLCGALWVTQAALPFLREQGSGHILQVSSIGGLMAFGSLGMYNASKWALEGISQALAQEVAAFGIKVTLIEPTGYSIDFSDSRFTTPHPAYDGVRQWAASRQLPPPADRVATRSAILQLVDSPNPPLRIFFGVGPLPMVTAEYESRLGTWREWESLSIQAHGALS